MTIPPRSHDDVGADPRVRPGPTRGSAPTCHFLSRAVQFAAWGEDMGRHPGNRRGVSRRQVLKSGAAALSGSAALLAGATPDAQNARAPAVLTGAQTGRTFRGLVRHDTTLDVQELRLLPIDPRQVVIRSQAVAPCYTIVRGALGTSPIRRAEVPNHCGF